jgi:hypothetical protein
MRFLSFLALSTVLLMGYSQQAHADKATYWDALYHTGYKHNFEPYVGKQVLKQRSTIDNDSWTPEDWIDNPGDEKVIIRDFYTMDILEKQYMDGEIPVLRVGEAFMLLSKFDQVRVLTFLDYVFEITTSSENGMFYVYSERDDDNPLGLYNKYGFQNH